MTLLAAIDCCRFALDYFTQDIIQRPENFARVGMVAGLKLIELGLVALGAIFGRDNRGNEIILMLESIGVGLSRTMTFVAADVGRIVP